MNRFFINMVKYFIPNELTLEEETHRKARLTVGAMLIIAYFNINYIFISLIMDYPGGIVSQLFLLNVTLICLWWFRSNIAIKALYFIYFASCSISISITVYYSGGFESVTFPWLASTPIVALLVWSKRGSLFSLFFVILIQIVFFYLHQNDFEFPNQMPEKFAKPFSLTTELGLVLILFWIAFVFENAKNTALNNLNIKNNELQKEKEKSDELLLNILPHEIAEELKSTGGAVAKQYNNVSVLFTDFVNFTGISENLTPIELVSEIHHNFTIFDNIIEKHGLEKIKTIGDAYLAVCGLPIDNPLHAENTINAAIEIRDYLATHKGKFQIRIGIHSGPVIAGIVGVKKYAYDIWGDTVNTAARMEQNSDSGKINISESTYELVKDKFTFQHRGKISAKNKGEIDMYYVD
jgi:adenylate cyclase